jgi:hypothetical protein
MKKRRKTKNPIPNKNIKNKDSMNKMNYHLIYKIFSYYIFIVSSKTKSFDLFGYFKQHTKIFGRTIRFIFRNVEIPSIKLSNKIYFSCSSITSLDI